MFAEIMFWMVVLRQMVGRRGVASIIHVSSNDSDAAVGTMNYWLSRPLAARVTWGGLSRCVPSFEGGGASGTPTAPACTHSRVTCPPGPG